MKIAVVYNGTSKPSAVCLAKTFSEVFDTDVQSIFYNSRRIRDKNITHFINVGNSNKFLIVGKPNIINDPSAIAKSANKRLARIRFKVKGVPAPALWLEPEEIPVAEYPVVGRKTFHMKGRGFWLCKSPREALNAKAKGATHFMKFISNTREFRLHTFSTNLHPTNVNDYVIGKFAEKLESASTRDRTIKNHDHGFVFMAPKLLTITQKDKLENAAKKALLAFGLNYGGVDIMLSKDNNNPYVLEINSTPCLTDENSNTAEVYSKMLMDMIRD